MYLRILFFGCAGSSLLHVGFSLVAVDRGLLFVVARGLLLSRGFSCGGARALGTQALVVVALGLSCFVARGIFPDQGSNQWPLH